MLDSPIVVKKRSADTPGRAGPSRRALPTDPTVLAVRRGYGARLPLVFMNSFRTRDDTLAALERYPDLADADLPDLHQEKTMLAAARRVVELAGR